MIFDKAKRYILLDDDIGITTAWELEAYLHDIELQVFNSINKFKRYVVDVNRSTVLFIDVNLSDNVSGLSVAMWCVEKGFENIYLVTGDPLFFSKSFDGISGVLDKYPPFFVSS